MTGPDLDQRAFDAAYAELPAQLTDEDARGEVARAIADAVREDYEPGRVERPATDVRPVYVDLRGLRPADVDAAVAAAARVLAEGSDA